MRSADAPVTVVSSLGPTAAASAPATQPVTDSRALVSVELSTDQQAVDPEVGVAVSTNKIADPYRISQVDFSQVEPG